jgi:ABC-type oligopeptide transport system substrate-binding subunit
VRRLGLPLALIAAGASLLVAAQLAGASGAKSGGIFRVGTTGASVQVDPQVAYITTAWWLEYATAAKLYNWQDGTNRIVPEVASGVRISNFGRRYSFTIRKGFRFSDGSPVTAKSFAYAIDRVANHDLASPGAQFIIDQSAADIVGAQAVNLGAAQHVRGVTAKGRTLTIRLVHADPAFLFVMTMPFFQATSKTLQLTHEVTGSYPSAGPYFYSRNDVNVETSIRRNPYWKRGPGRMRPRNLTGVDVIWNQDEDALLAQVQAGQIDEDPWIPPDEVQGVADEYGVNKTRFWVKPFNCTGSLLFNNANPLFRKNVPLRKAINWAVDRTDYVAVSGPYAGSPWTHLLPPGFPGSSSKTLKPYGAHADIPKAKKLAAGHFRSGHIVVIYPGYGPYYVSLAQLVRRDLMRLGFDPAKIDLRPNGGGGAPPPPPPADWDLAVAWGWCSDIVDPYDFFQPFLTDPAEYPFLLPSLASKHYQARILAAARLVGNARLAAFGRLDVDIMRDLAPMAPMRTYNNRYLFSGRVRPASLVYSGAYQDWDLTELALK